MLFSIDPHILSDTLDTSSWLTRTLSQRNYTSLRKKLHRCELQTASRKQMLAPLVEVDVWYYFFTRIIWHTSSFANAKKNIQSKKLSKSLDTPTSLTPFFFRYVYSCLHPRRPSYSRPMGMNKSILLYQTITILLWKLSNKSSQDRKWHDLEKHKISSEWHTISEEKRHLLKLRILYHDNNTLLWHYPHSAKRNVSKQNSVSESPDHLDQEKHTPPYSSHEDWRTAGTKSASSIQRMDPANSTPTWENTMQLPSPSSILLDTSKP